MIRYILYKVEKQLLPVLALRNLRKQNLAGASCHFGNGLKNPTGTRKLTGMRTSNLYILWLDTPKGKTLGGEKLVSQWFRAVLLGLEAARVLLKLTFPFKQR